MVKEKPCTSKDEAIKDSKRGRKEALKLIIMERYLSVFQSQQDVYRGSACFTNQSCIVTLHTTYLDVQKSPPKIVGYVITQFHCPDRFVLHQRRIYADISTHEA
jgi:hypothetical protein